MSTLIRPIVPPLGPKPKWVLEELRIQELKKVFRDFIDANYPIKLEWIEEYNELIERNAKTEDI
jgi:hypothetical protein